MPNQLISAENSLFAAQYNVVGKKMGLVNMLTNSYHCDHLIVTRYI